MSPFYTYPQKKSPYIDKKLQLLKVTGKLLLKNEREKHYIFAGNSSINISLKEKFDHNHQFKKRKNKTNYFIKMSTILTIPKNKY
jgi:hypothetical protein